MIDLDLRSAGDGGTTWHSSPVWGWCACRMCSRACRRRPRRRRSVSDAFWRLGYSTSGRVSRDAGLSIGAFVMLPPQCPPT